jgi:hypothetical protein
MTNGFERHNIDHLSASSINLWTNAPDLWVARYLLGRRTPFGPAPKRGQVVESAVVWTLMGESQETAVTRATENFDREFMFGDEDVAKERDLIAPMTTQAINELRDYGAPEFASGTDQEKVSITARGDGWAIPVWGFLDLVFPDHGLVVDLKTTTRVPSVMSSDHQLQRAIYAKAKGNMAVKFLYVSAKKSAWLEDGDVAATLAKAKAQISRIEAFLRHHDAEEARACVPCNPNSFFWRGAETLRSEIYGL